MATGSGAGVGTLSGADAQALLARRRQRMEARGATQHDIASGWIRSTGYQDQAQLMVMRTRDTATKTGEHRPGRVYGFRDVPAAHYAALTKADHLGLGLIIAGLLPQQAGAMQAAKLLLPIGR